ncbi:hypothetical protein [Deinococcus sp. Leaf326]|uniref:hypothetical protein n=1 Tax=Deinococcus sp. Leaf326 TaxID=1736338 RepID=UPI0006F71993|nr:hypothetical protein [Deinococcus sp. Leaf326]KQR18796.1 hypothetical protein ASF71_19895 [Deinococcus sp. Leaf326]
MNKPFTVQVSQTTIPTRTLAIEQLRKAAAPGSTFLLRLKRLSRLIAHGRVVKLHGHPNRIAAMEHALLTLAQKLVAETPVMQTIGIRDVLEHLTDQSLRVTLCRPDGWPVSTYVFCKADPEARTILVECEDGKTRAFEPDALLALFTTTFLLRVRLAVPAQVLPQAA